MIHDCILGLWLSPSGECHPGCGGSAPPPTGNASLSSVFTKPPLIGDNLCLVVFTGRRSRGSFHLSQVSHGKASIRHLSSASLSPFDLQMLRELLPGLSPARPPLHRLLALPLPLSSPPHLCPLGFIPVCVIYFALLMFALPPPFPQIHVRLCLNNKSIKVPRRKK